MMIGPSSKFVPSALYICVFLYVFTEVLLSPFYPQFFQKVFGIDDLSYTGFYIFVCRFTVVLFAPLWGLLSRYVEVRHLLFFGQAATALFTALLATSDTANQFMMFSVLLLMFKSSYLLVYPLLVQINGQHKSASVAGSYHAVFHLAIIVSTVAGAWMIHLKAPLDVFYWVAIADLIQLGLCWAALRGTVFRQDTSAPNETKGVRDQIGFLLMLGMVILTFHLANNVVRPFFTKYTESDFGLSLVESSLIFLIPSLMFIIAMPFIKSWSKPERLTQLLVVGLTVLAISLYLQGWAESLLLLIIGRLLYGFFLAVTQAALEIRLFNNSSSNRLHFNYSLAVSFQNIGLLMAPLLASTLVSLYSLAAPLVVAAVLCVVTLVFARLTVFQPR
jgi:DHA1 family multidrug resistance protein-like MFS transporter